MARRAGSDLLSDYLDEKNGKKRRKQFSSFTVDELTELSRLSQIWNDREWRRRKSESWSFYCPLCKSARTIPFRPRPSSLHHLFQLFLTTSVLVIAGWNWFGFKGFVVFFPLWAVYELVYRTRLRAVMSCPHCAFDPYLYLTDVDRARREVETHFRKVFEEKGIPYPTPSSSLTEPTVER